MRLRTGGVSFSIRPRGGSILCHRLHTPDPLTADGLSVRGPPLVIRQGRMRLAKARSVLGPLAVLWDAGIAAGREVLVADICGVGI